MEEIKVKSEEEYENVELIVVEQKDSFGKESKILKIITNIILAISKFVFKLTVIVAIYSVIFAGVVYYSNKFVVTKLREIEANKKTDPVLEELLKDKDEAQRKEDEEKKEKEEEKADKEDKAEDTKKEENKTDKDKNKKEKEDTKKQDSKTNKTDNKKK